MKSRFVGVLLLAATACGDEPPRYGAVTISQDSPRVELSGRTHGDTPAIELAPGCAGVVDTSGPDHVVELTDLIKLGVSASSEDGPVALVIERDGEYFCDSDDNTGHLPHMQITETGTYGIRVASLAPGQALSYRLLVAPDDKDAHARPAVAAQRSLVSITVTSEPAGAEVRTRTGQVLGTTPAMLELPREEAATDGSFTFVVAAPGRGEATVSGKPQGEQLVLHAELQPAGPELVELESATAQPIRDFRTAEQRVELSRECAIQDIEVDVEIHHSYVGDLLVQLQSPSGTTATLHRYGGQARAHLERTYTTRDTRALRQLIGERGAGTWVMTVRDNAEIDIGTFDGFKLRVTCASPGTAVPTATASTSGTSPTTLGGLRIPTFFRQNPPPTGSEVLDPWGP
jgi:subtilisin-like proprotein convertase family protein